MQARSLHPWDLTPREAIQLQKRLRRRVRAASLPAKKVRLIAGADISWDPATRTGYAGVIVFSWPGLEEVERASAQGPATFPYVPGLLSFRETPLLLDAFLKLKTEPDLIFIDGHGRAHPRRFGIACHIGLLLNKPTIGCAKSRLTGAFKPPNASRGAQALLRDQGETIGTVLRTKDATSPIFISVGHRITLPAAVRWALACGDGSRIPKPTREADRYVGQIRHLDVNSKTYATV
jgi:deoxyribonuclease V